jgi:DNA polymerase-3 subunit epsilon
VQANVTKKLDILVLADPDSLSGKARTARRYGTRLIAEPVFWRELGVTID